MVMWHTPQLRDPWPETAREWELYALCSQLDADYRRMQARAAREGHRREMAAMAKAGGVVIGCLLTMALAYVLIWGLWAVAG